MNDDSREGWVYSHVGDIVEVKYGKGLKESNRLNGSVQVFGSNGPVGTHNAPLTKGPTVIVGRKGSIGAVHYCPEPCWPIDTTYFIDEFSEAEPEYLAHALRSLNLSDLDTSTAVPGLNRDDLYAQEILLPPLSEQKRIVSELRKLLPQVVGVRERLNRTQATLKRFRQAVLSAACSGRLTEDWRDSHDSLPVSVTSTGEYGELPESWTWKRVAELAISARGSIQSGPFGSNLLHSEFQSTGVLAIGIDNVLDGRFSFGKQHRISSEKYDALKKYTARPLDVLITVMATVGRCCVVPKDIEIAIITKHVYRISCEQKLVNPYFLLNCLRGSAAIQEQIRSEIRGVTRPGINGAILKELLVPLPTLDEQEEIVRRVEALFALADQIEARCAQAKAHADNLTQSILGKAFRGELIPEGLD